MGRPESSVEKLSRRFVDQPRQPGSDRRLDIGVGEHRATKIEFPRDPLQEQRSFFRLQRASGDHHHAQLSVGKRYRGARQRQSWGSISWRGRAAKHPGNLGHTGPDISKEKFSVSLVGLGSVLGDPTAHRTKPHGRAPRLNRLAAGCTLAPSPRLGPGRRLGLDDRGHSSTANRTHALVRAVERLAAVPFRTPSGAIEQLTTTATSPLALWSGHGDWLVKP